MMDVAKPQKSGDISVRPGQTNLKKCFLHITGDANRFQPKAEKNPTEIRKENRTSVQRVIQTKLVAIWLTEAS